MIVTNLSTSMAIDDLAKQHNIDIVRSNVGEINVVNEMKNVKAIIGGEGNGGFVDEGNIYVAGKIDHIANTNEKGETIVGTGGTYAHYWINGEKIDLIGGVWNNMWVSTAYDIAVSEDVIIVSGDVATKSQTQVPAIWVNNELKLLEDSKTNGIDRRIIIE